MLTQREIMNMENLMVRDSYWNDSYWGDEDEDDHIVMVMPDGTKIYEEGYEPEEDEDE